MTRAEFKPMIDLIYTHYKPADKWTVESIGEWLGWAADHGFLIESIRDEQTTGLLIVRPVSKLPDNDWYTFDLNGDIIHIDLAIAVDKETSRELGLAMLELMGERPFIALRNHQDKVKLHKTRKAMTALLKMEY